MLKSFEKDNFKINVFGTPEELYFKASDIAGFLGYKDKQDAIKKHVDNEDKFTIDKIQARQNTPFQKCIRKQFLSTNPVCIR